MRRGEAGNRGTDRQEAGQALVELAIAMPILLALLIGIFEFARAWNIQQVITNAAREGARVAVLRNSSPDQVNAAIDTRLASANVDASKVSKHIAVTNTPGTDDTVRVDYAYEYRFLGGAVRLISAGGWSGSITLRSESVMRNE